MIYRAAVIGCGKIGTTNSLDPLIKGVCSHAGAYMACPQTELVAVCDVDRSRAEACGKQWGIKSVYSDPGQLIQEIQPEIISICSPNETHGEMLSRALASNSTRGVITEKPLTLHVPEAARLVRLAEDRNIHLAVNYSRRYSKGHAEMRAFIHSDALGKVQTVTGYYTKGIFHNGTHWLDLAHWMFGDVKQVTAFNLRNRQELDCQLDASMVFESGATAFLQGLDPSAYALFEMDVLGTKGRVRVTQEGHQIEYFAVVDSPHYSGFSTVRSIGQKNGEMENNLLNAVEDLVNSITEKRNPSCTGTDGLKALVVASSLMKSGMENRSIIISE